MVYQSFQIMPKQESAMNTQSRMIWYKNVRVKKSKNGVIDNKFARYILI